MHSLSSPARMMALALPAIVLAAIGPDCVNGPLADNKICDVTATPLERATALVGAMEAEEKLGQLVSKSKGVSRIGLPPYNWWGEALHGVAGAPGINFTGDYKIATSFPMPVLMAAAFDDDLIQEIATIISIEARAFGNGGVAPLDFWTPNVNTFKDPRWGRGSETPGEDVLRVKRYAASVIAGLEGDDEKERRVIATCKHYAGNDLENWNGVTRHDFDAIISQQDLAEYYLQPFQTCARDSRVGSFMCSYNAVNGVPACANEFLMGTILREHWKWQENNYITSDCEAVLDISANHKYVATNAEGTGLAFNSGMDSSCEYEGSSDIPGAWSGGYLNETIVDRALTRIYRGLVTSGYFDGESAKYASLGPSDINTKPAQELARRAAAESLVLLKNEENALPFTLTNGTKVAMIGFWAGDQKKLQGGYSGPAPFLHSPAWAAQQLGISVKNVTGPISQSNSAPDTWTENALAAAEDAEYILYFGGQDTSAAAEGLDRQTLAWPAAQLTLINKLADLGKPLAVIQMGDMLDNTPLLTNTGVNSILWASWPGQDGGPAVLDIVSGAKAPAGRLPLTQYPVNYTDAVPMTDMNLRPSDTNPGRTYRWYADAVQTFGFGLHYTNFKVAAGASNSSSSNSSATWNIQELVDSCSNEFLDTCALPPLSLSITNAGNRTSDFVALAFVKSENGPKPYPLKTLSAYARVHDVAGGSTKAVGLEWTLGNIARHDESGNTVLYPGSYEVELDEPVQATWGFELTGEEAVLDKWPTPPS
ncbi:unnamed protein product [Periconia digitata]|uniref:xylan 1,4-beta-xylosidase n=1 Tax=Periconia digitata TaxID=1303443 RepID=A0A9W4UKD4_9PLEO|nr:unnamed protein product [Periconia digitata]